jgi:hypothetical protein
MLALGQFLDDFCFTYKQIAYTDYKTKNYALKASTHMSSENHQKQRCEGHPIRPSSLTQSPLCAVVAIIFSWTHSNSEINGTTIPDSDISDFAAL